MNTDLQEFKGVLLLTEREYEVFKAIGQGLSPREIAVLEGRRVSVDSVHKMYQRMMDKLNTEDWRKTFRMAVRYECLGLKRIAVVPPPPQYKFAEEPTEQNLDLSFNRNGLSVPLNGEKMTKTNMKT